MNPSGAEDRRSWTKRQQNRESKPSTEPRKLAPTARGVGDSSGRRRCPLVRRTEAESGPFQADRPAPRRRTTYPPDVPPPVRQKRMPGHAASTRAPSDSKRASATMAAAGASSAGTACARLRPSVRNRAWPAVPVAVIGASTVKENSAPRPCARTAAALGRLPGKPEQTEVRELKTTLDPDSPGPRRRATCT